MLTFLLRCIRVVFDGVEGGAQSSITVSLAALFFISLLCSIPKTLDVAHLLQVISLWTVGWG